MKIKDYWKKDALVDSSKYIDLYENSIQNNDNFWDKITQNSTPVEKD